MINHKQSKELSRSRPLVTAALSYNPAKIYTLGFFQVFLVILPIVVPFFQSKGLSMQEVFILQAIFGAVIVFSEVPSGYLADCWSRKGALLVGALLTAIGHSFLLIADGFWILVAFEVFLGAGVSLLSGADLAILYDTKTALGKPPAEHGKGIAHLYFIQNISEAVSAVLCSIILLWSIQSVVLLQVIVGWLPLLIALTIQEPPTTTLPSKNHLENFRLVGKALLFKDGIMRLIVLSLAVWSLGTFYVVWLLQKYWENIGIPLIWFGYLWAAYALIAGVSGRFAGRVEESFGAPILLLVIGGLPVLGALGMAWFDSLVSLVFAIAFFVARGLGLVSFRKALNSRIESTYRATANSLANFAFRACFVVTGPLLGYVLDFWGMEVALYGVAVFTFLVLVLIITPLALMVSKRTRIEPSGEIEININQEPAAVVGHP